MRSLKHDMMYDDHKPPHTPIVTAQIPPTHTMISKYHTMIPPPHKMDVSSQDECFEEQGAALMTEKPEYKVGDAPGTRRKEEKSSSLMKKCSYTKGGKCREHGTGAREKLITTSTNVIGPDGGITVKREKKKIFVCDVTKKTQPQTSKTVKKTTASSKTTSTPEDNPADIISVGKEERHGDIIKDKRRLKQSTLSFKKTTPTLKTTPVVEDNPHDILNDTVGKGERFCDVKFYTRSEGATTTQCEDRGIRHEEDEQ